MSDSPSTLISILGNEYRIRLVEGQEQLVGASARLLNRALGEARELRLEELFLQVGVVQLGIRVGDFHPAHEQFKPLGDGGIRPLALRQRADARRIVHDENRADERVFDLLFEDLPENLQEQ